VGRRTLTQSINRVVLCCWHIGEPEGRTEFSRSTCGEQQAKDWGRNADALRTAGDWLEFVYKIAHI